jgi:hypothetical protein
MPWSIADVDVDEAVDAGSLMGSEGLAVGCTCEQPPSRNARTRQRSPASGVVVRSLALRSGAEIGRVRRIVKRLDIPV